MTREIPLHNGLVALVDEDDYAALLPFHWIARRSSQKRENWHAMRNTYDDRRVGHVYMHRQILSIPPTLEVDHINRNGLDNRRTNLRMCSRSQNCANIVSRPGKSGFRGVHPSLRGDKWYAQIEVRGEIMRSGVLPTREKAAREYDRLARLYFGEFATLNFD